MGSNKILILGAGIYQVPLIKKAKEMGLFVIVSSINGNYPGFKFADKIYYSDTTNEESVLKIARDEGVAGVCTAGTDVALLSLGRVVDELSLKGPSYHSSLLASNKYEMKQAFMENNVRTARYVKVSSAEQATSVFLEFEKSVIFKAVDSSGSRGIKKVESDSDIRSTCEYVAQNSNKNYFIVEEFIEGEEFGAQALVVDGEIKFIMPHGDVVFQGETGVPVGHFVPYNLMPEILDDLERQLSRSIDALGINDCAVNADFILKDNKVYVLEIGARAGATCLAEMVSIHYGVDYFEQLINVSLGKKIENDFTAKNACAAELLVSSEGGIIKNIINTNSKESFINELFFDYGPGDKIPVFQVGPDRIGHIIVTGADTADSLKNLDFVKNNIKVELE